MKSTHLHVAAALLLGNLAYLLAVATSFNLTLLSRTGYAPAIILLLTIIGGISAVGLGYASILILGGRCSLGVANFLAGIARAKHVIEHSSHSEKSSGQKLLEHTFIAYTSALVFLLLVAIAWALHNADGPRSSIFYPLLNATNIFLTGTGNINPVRFSITSIPLLLCLTVLAGVTPAITLPYLRNFKITSINSGPFHTQLLLLIVGLLAGLSAILTVVGLIYRVLWADVGREPPAYHFLFLVMLGFSIHYALGSYLGRDKAERMIVEQLTQKPKSRIFLGTVDVKRKAEQIPQSA